MIVICVAVAAGDANSRGQCGRCGYVGVWSIVTMHSAADAHKDNEVDDKYEDDGHVEGEHLRVGRQETAVNKTKRIRLPKSIHVDR